MNAEQEVRDIIYRLKANYPIWPSTFGACQTEECENGARGARFCAECITLELGKVIGNEKAEKFRDAVSETARLEAEIYERAYEQYFNKAVEDANKITGGINND